MFPPQLKEHENGNNEQNNYKPLISIVIPVYNGIMNGLENCLKSILSQTYANIEIIMVDDCSSDSSLEIAKKMLLKGRDSVIKHKENKGLSGTWNDGILNSNGEYILLIQQDCSLSHPEVLNDTIRRMISAKELFLTGYQQCDTNSLNFFQKLFRIRINEGGANPFNGLTTSVTENKCDLIKSSLMNTIGVFEDSFKNVGQDFVFSMKLTRLGIKLEIAEELSYQILYNGENTLKKVATKEYKYGKEVYPLYTIWRKNNFISGMNSVNDLGSKKLRSRVLNLIFPVLFVILLIFAVFLETFLWVLLVFVIIWFVSASTKIRSHHKKNLDDRVPIILSTVVMLVLDFIYALGIFIGLVDVFTYNEKMDV